ncbi:MAG: hypothetical protein J6M94_06785 [Prevotella sp.]|nr:hypothetical protein [Prevotella sp.]
MKKYMKPAMAIAKIEVENVILAGSTKLENDSQDLSGAGTTTETSGNLGNEGGSVWGDED